jgi:hypothetical protein
MFSQWCDYGFTAVDIFGWSGLKAADILAMGGFSLKVVGILEPGFDTKSYKATQAGAQFYTVGHPNLL